MSNIAGILCGRPSKNKNQNSNIELTPTVKTKASFNTCFKCKTESFLSRITDTTEGLPLDMTCNGFLYSEKAYSYNIYSEKSEGILTLSQAHTYSAFLNGNMMFISNGYVSNGTCAGDYVYSVGFAMPGDQNSCASGSGVSEQRLIWNMFQIIGTCSSVCYGKGVIDLKPGINNKGATNF